MRMTKEQKCYCASNLVSMIIESLVEIYPNKSQDELVAWFSKTETYSKLFDFGTTLWTRGPDYILEVLGDEVGVKLVKR